MALSGDDLTFVDAIEARVPSRDKFTVGEYARLRGLTGEPAAAFLALWNQNESLSVIWDDVQRLVDAARAVP